MSECVSECVCVCVCLSVCVSECVSYRRMRVSVLTGAPEDVHGVICFLLVHWVGEVDGVGVLHPPVSPKQHAANHQQTHGDCVRERGHSPDDRSVRDCVS